jgi:heme-degrading monooxygenase HmoA
VINRLAIKPGKIDEFIEAQQDYAATLMKSPTGLIGSRLYRSVDGMTVVLLSQFESFEANEKIRQTDAFKQNLSRLQSLVESSSPAFYDEAYTTGDFK